MIKASTLLILCITATVFATYFAIASIGREEREFQLRLAELVVEGVHIEKERVETWGVLCVGYLQWAHNQNHQGPDLMEGNCDFIVKEEGK